ncbi:serine protease FAM111A-like isoform X1 [Acanthochromis polyacanthus]|uniref:serine protease FAM111A-like isoform X1 n=1 Tax=Acanthochromis polyacanthus TaxID=80966 RepID=UPI0022341842|nr:serine protease FAM111A-like isoform X1 [Acanthochromis polyacanthus]
MDAAREVKQEEVKEEEKKEEEDADSKVRHSHQFTVKFSNEDVEYTIDCDQPHTVLEMDAAREVKIKKEEEEEEKKEEEDADSKVRHSHQFTVKFSNEDVEYTIDCDQPRTVLEVIKSDLPKQFQRMKDKMKDYSDLKIIIQLSKKGKESIVATHFPCSCIENGECLVIHCKTQEVEETKIQHDELLPRDKYFIFYIATKAGVNARKEKRFRSKSVKEFDYLCVYAKKGTSVKEALERDGRFVDLKDFKLSEVQNSNQHTLCTQKVDNLDQKKFKICRDRKPANYENEQVSSEQQGQGGQGGQQGQEEYQEQLSTSKQSQQKFSTKSVLDAAQKSGISVKRVMEETGSKVNPEEIYKLLCEQFQDLKSLMKKRFPGDSYQEALELKKENFGKIQQSFSEVHRVRELLRLGGSVCKIIVSGVWQGTGFVLFDRLILTNAHLFKDCVKENKLQEDIEVYALFNYDKPEPFTKYYIFTAEKTFIDFDLELDYAILELNPQGQKHNQTGEAELPPGLLSKFGPLPDNGEACLIGHPAGAVKQIDPTCIIPMEKREEAVDKQLHPYKEHSSLSNQSVT